MKVYLATSGEYSDYRVRQVFARQEDAEAYPLGDDWEEFEVSDGPVEVRTWHELTWRPAGPDGPHIYSGERRDFDGDERHVDHEWSELTFLHVRGWDLARVKKVYSEQRAQYLARGEGIA